MSLQPEIPTHTITPQSKFWRIIWVGVVGILPLLISCLLILIPDFLGPSWQSGRVADYLTLFISRGVFFIFAPFLLFGSVSLLYLIINDPTAYRCSPTIRLGIYTGTLLALQFTILAFYNVLFASEIVWIVLVIIAVCLFYKHIISRDESIGKLAFQALLSIAGIFLLTDVTQLEPEKQAQAAANAQKQSARQKDTSCF